MTFNLPPSLHLSHEQLCDCLLDAAPDRQAFVEDHLQSCALCAAEYNRLETSLTGLREASTRFAQGVLAEMKNAQPAQPAQPAQAGQQRPRHRLGIAFTMHYAKPLTWATAALATVAVLVPAGVHWHTRTLEARAVLSSSETSSKTTAGIQTPNATQAQSQSQSDEALLESIDQDLSVSVPTAMSPLDNPLNTQSAVVGRKTNDISTESTNSLARKKISNE